MVSVKLTLRPKVFPALKSFSQPGYLLPAIASAAIKDSLLLIGAKPSLRPSSSMPACVPASASTRSRVDFRCNLLMSKVVFIVCSHCALNGFPKALISAEHSSIDLRRRLSRYKSARIDNAVFDRDVRVRKHAHDALQNVINAGAANHTTEHRKRVTPSLPS